MIEVAYLVDDVTYVGLYHSMNEVPKDVTIIKTRRLKVR